MSRWTEEQRYAVYRQIICGTDGDLDALAAILAPTIRAERDAEVLAELRPLIDTAQWGDEGGAWFKVVEWKHIEAALKGET